MNRVTTKSLSALIPIEFNYSYYKNEKLKFNTTTYKEGYSFIEYTALKNFQDITINNQSCFILTSALNLDDVFDRGTEYNLGQLPGSCVLQPRNSQIYYINYNPVNNTFIHDIEQTTIFYFSPIKNTNTVEILVNNQYVQIDEEYPYTARLQTRTLDPESIHRQRFECVYQKGLITFKTRTNTGYRYLSFGTDFILRAIGTMFNNSIVNDYVFRIIEITPQNITTGFAPNNSWVTYYFDNTDQTNNKTVALKRILPTQTHLLFDFPYNNTVLNGIANLNIANLKTSITPQYGPAPIVNINTN